MKIPYWAKILFSVVICNLVGLASSGVTIEAIPGWYSDLNKPFFNPPGWIFGPVWTLLYSFMGVAAAAIWHVGIQKEDVRKALWVFSLQLALNGIWPFLFFGLQLPLLAFFEIIILLIAITLTISLFKKIKSWTAYLLLPYLMWVLFASILNLAIYILN